jgi:hypothetical protein
LCSTQEIAAQNGIITEPDMLRALLAAAVTIRRITSMAA